MIARLRRPRDVSSVEGILSILGLANPSPPLSLSVSIFPSAFNKRFDAAVSKTWYRAWGGNRSWGGIRIFWRWSESIVSGNEKNWSWVDRTWRMWLTNWKGNCYIRGRIIRRIIASDSSTRYFKNRIVNWSWDAGAACLPFLSCYYSIPSSLLSSSLLHSNNRSSLRDSTRLTSLLPALLHLLTFSNSENRFVS